ncbi:MAG TPA: zf-HC2 domain-containing protein [Vicinamibacterales bacterium]|nr:zf-HC2 domain-containing protein [Vicinamibacterales bacterium]
MCDERERLIGYVYDECDPDERQVIADHVASCETCQQEISGLRRVREDLLAWDVPEYESVWRPFVPPRAASWRDLPVWALAAAAVLLLLAGGAGGAVTYAMLPHRPVLTAAAAPRPAAVVPASDVVHSADLEALEARLTEKFQNEVDERVKLVAAHASAPAIEPASDVATSPEDLRRQVQALRVTLDRVSKAQDQLSKSVYADLMSFGETQRRIEQGNNYILTSLVRHAPADGSAGR